MHTYSVYLMYPVFDTFLSHCDLNDFPQRTVLLAAVYNVLYVISYFQGLCAAVHICLASFSNLKTLQLDIYIIARVIFYGVYSTVSARQCNRIVL